MIVVYPMLVSSNVQANVLPGISKVIEKFVLIYKMDEIIKEANRLAKGKRILITGTKLKLSEGEEIDAESTINEAKGSSAIPIQVVGGGGGGGGKSEKPKDVGTVKIDTPNFGAISLEPTWIKIDTAKGTRLVGVKVIPFPVQSDAQLIDSILSDKGKGRINSLLSTIGRKVTRTMWAAARTAHIPFLPVTISGDPRKDIIWARTTHKGNIFLVMNLLDLGTEFFEKTDRIKWLYRLGWSSFAVTDDINKRVYFCMKEFNGLCSTVQYNFMYTSIGSEHGRVFNDLEDVKKSSSPFFKLTTKSSAIVGDRMAVNKKEKYGK